MTSLLKYDIARRAIAEAKTFDEVREWEDKAAAVREYGRRIEDRQMELDALEIRQDARRRRGQLLLALKAEGKLVEGRKKLSTTDDSFRVTLVDLDVTPDESARDQKIAALDGDSYSRLVARCRKYAEDHPEKHTLDVLRPPEEPVGARATMAGRLEDTESLDYFPTPPWSTRALIETVFPRIGARLEGTIWEPACGEGHMAEVIAEYGKVHASDIHPYGYGQVADFLDVDDQVDWIITNPPFGDKATAFIKHAFDCAENVAMFLQLRYLEGIDRYTEVFKDRPPTQVCFFVERVPLHRGRWEPQGDTATAYCWLVWIKDRFPRAPFWIPPGQREALTRPDDAERFTTHPVTKQIHNHAASDSDTPAACEPAPDEALTPASSKSPGAGSTLSDDDWEDDSIPAFLRRDATNGAAQP